MAEIVYFQQELLQKVWSQIGVYNSLQTLFAGKCHNFYHNSYAGLFLNALLWLIAPI